MKVIELIFSAIDEINNDLSEKIIKDEDTVIFGMNSSLDSIGLVNFITIIEEKLEDETGKYIAIANERAMSMEESPFKTVGTLKKYIEVLITE